MEEEGLAYRDHQDHQGYQDDRDYQDYQEVVLGAVLVHLGCMLWPLGSILGSPWMCRGISGNMLGMSMRRLRAALAFKTNPSDTKRR